MPKIRLSHVVKEFRTKAGSYLAVDDVSLDVASGSFCVIVGPSGCGKTTLLRMVAGLETPTSGTIAVARGDGARVENAMVFQGNSLFPWMTVFDNAAYGLSIRNVPKREIEEVVGHYLNRTGLTKFRDAYPHQLSGGMKQRVSIVRAFANDPDVLLMDEPFSALDEQNRTLLQEELLRIWDETKKTVLFITHSVDEAVTLGDEIVVMTAHPGRLKALVPVRFDRPRKVLELRMQPAYGALVYEIWSHLRDEVDRAHAEQAV